MDHDPVMSSKRGTTLLELLVALGIATLVIAVVVLAHQALTRQAAQQGVNRRTADRMDATTRALRTDLQNLFTTAGDEATVVALDQTDEGRLKELSFCCWERNPAEPPPFDRQLGRVTYRVDSRDGRPELLRIRRGLAGAGAMAPPVTNWIEGAWTALGVRLHDGETWQSRWPVDPAQEESTTPNAARLTFFDEDQPDATSPVSEAVILIPAALSVTSRLERAAQAK